MKNRQECEVSVAAALQALCDDVRAETAEDMGRLLTLTISTLCDGMVAALGHQFAADTLRMSLQRVQSRVLVDAHGGTLQ